MLPISFTRNRKAVNSTKTALYIRMNTIIVFISFTAIFFLLNTSKNAILNNGLIEKWIQRHSRTAKIIGLLLGLLSFFVGITVYGVTTGIFITLFISMLILSIYVIFNPLKYANYKFVLLLFVIVALLEILMD